MLELKSITKVYEAGGTEVRALREVSLKFRESEFVSVLGPSGCGKTTLLNLIGGLDRATDGDLIINGRSTKDFRDGDWDAYRNNSVGFVFQSYNLIPHQSVISNVELALTLSGVSKTERLDRAKTVLERVGLGDQLYKKPNQLSGGQMQRVAIARALVNNPDILLADEPTGALDSETSVQIMELLREIAADKLVIMVTHNPELADTYSTRIIRLLDGFVKSDTDPVLDTQSDDVDSSKFRRTSMSFFTAVSLSFKNLLTKKARTLLTAFAGSIGIIGIALILAFSNGLQTYISSVERDTLSSYPITIEHETMDLTALLSSFGGAGTQDDGVEISENEIRVRSVMTRIMNTMLSQVKSNDLKSFKAYIEEPAIQTELDGYVTAVEYTYDVPLNLYFTGGEAPYQVNPGQIMQSLGMNQPQGPAGMSNPMMGNADMWSPLIPNDEFLADQYDVLAGKMPAGFDEAVLVIGKDNVIPDIMLFALGLSGQAELDEMLAALTAGGELSENTGTYTFDEILSLEYSLLLPTETYEKTPDGGWADKSGDAAFIAGKLAAAPKIKIVGILRPSEDAAAVSENVFIGYTQLLTEYVVNAVNDSEIVKAQLSAPDRDVFTGNPFGAPPVISNMQELSAYINSMPEAERTQAGTAIEQMIAAGMSDEQLLAMMNASIAGSWTQGSYDGNLELLGVTSLDTPSSINIYASSFENKELVAELIDRYNAAQPEGAEITFTDYVGLLMSSVTTVINAISYVLIAFVSISLVVSSIMIGIITYISVLERTREIGVLRSIGASKKDISRVFNAETLIVGLAAGLLGIIVTALLCIPANAIVRGLTGIPNVAILPVSGAVGLVIISMALTLVAGLLPSGIAARKDPVVALRTE